MAGITRLISTTTVKPAGHQEPPIDNQRIELTPWDLQCLLVDDIQRGLLFLKPTHLDNNTLIHHLETSFSRTLDFFYPLAGSLATDKHDDGSSSCFIVCNNVGAPFTHAVADGVTVADVLEPFYVPNIIHSFFPLNGTASFQGVSKALFAVQVTELVDGVFIGCSLNHTVGDGTSFWHFFNSWSEISRGDSITNPPILRRWFLETTTPPIRFHLSEDEKQVLIKRLTPQPLLKERIFHFAKEKIAALKAKANAEIGANNRISSLQALLCHVWRSVTRSSHLDPDKEIKYLMAIGARRGVIPPLPSHYLGNSFHGGNLTMRVGELLEHGLGHVASKMNEMVVTSQTEERAKDFLESWIKNPKLINLGGGAIMGNSSLVTSSSPRFNMYGNDFGWGKPVAVRSGKGNKVYGKLTVFQGKEEGSVDIEICLFVETLETLVNDPEFMEFATAL